jgi:hypothetical protein
MTTSKEEQIFVGIDDQVIELTGEAKADFIRQRELDYAEFQTKQAEADAKAATRSSALAKLAAIGLTPEEIASL